MNSFRYRQIKFSLLIGSVSEKGELESRIRAKIKVRGMARRTENSYIQWYKHYVKYHGMKHPRDLGQGGVEKFLEHLAVDRGVAAATQNQAFSALLFLYREVLEMELKKSRIESSTHAMGGC